MARVLSRPGGIVVASASALLLWALSVHSQSEFLVGYATIEGAGNSALPVATALFALRNARGVLVAEAGVAAVQPIRRGRIFVDASVPTGLALANPSSEDVSASLTLRDRTGAHVGSTDIPIPAFQHRARFVSELFSPFPEGFIGSLTFDTTGPGLAALTIRQSVNAHGERLFATLPVAHLEPADRALPLTRSTAYRPAPISSPSGIGISLSPTSVQEGSSPLRSSSSIQLPGSLWERSNSRDPMAFRSPLSSMAPKDRAGQPGQPLDRRL